MYIQQEKKKKTSVFRVFILCALILAGLWFIKEQPEWARPFEPTPTPTQQAAFYINNGDIYFAEGNLYRAIEAYEQAISLEPANDVPYIRQAEILVYTGNTAKALTRAEKAVLLNPNSAENLAGYCQALDWEGQYARAAEACECAIEIDADYAPGYAYLSEVYADQAIWGAARSTAQQAIEVDFQNPQAHHNMGYAFEVQGRYAEAVEFYENAITLRPKLAAYYMAAGRNYYWLGQLENALERFGEAIKLNPTDPAAYDQLGWAYHTNGEDARAIDALEQALNVDNTYARAWGRLGTIYYLRQNYEEALKILPQAIALSEHQFLATLRSIEIFAQIESPSGPEMVPVLRGQFEPDITHRGTLTAQLLPIQWEQTEPSFQAAGSCGDLIAQTLTEEIILTSPIEDISFSQAFSRTGGTATLDITTGVVSVDLANVPRPATVPYEARIFYKPEKEESLGYLQPDSTNQINTQFTITTEGSAPVEYYYELGLSYAYLKPPQCQDAVPWLLKAVNKDPVYYNPAWEGLKICPSADSPPTPLPTFTPTPEQ